MSAPATWPEARCGEGPSASCYPAGSAVLNQAILIGSTRWPHYAVTVRAAGFGTVSALPMRRRDQAMDVISVLGTGDYRLPAAETRLAQILARAAAIAISRGELPAHRLIASPEVGRSRAARRQYRRQSW